jgi:hypothetical protein
MRIKTQAGKIAIIAAALTFAGIAKTALAQGCVAAHTAQPVISGLDATEQPRSADFLHGVHGLTLTFGFRTYSSFRHYVGTVYQVQRETAHNEVENHVDLYDLGINYQLTPRWSLIADIPAMSATRHQQGANPLNTYRSGGIGDVTIGTQAWIWRPPTESHGNVALSASLKLPTGISDAKGHSIAKDGTVSIKGFDESIQPGDGTWGFSLATAAYRELYFHTYGYFTGSWLFSPTDTTGINQANSATDQYLWRGGVSRNIPKVRGLGLSFGGRMEGVPVRDAFGKSDGFRRPGYVISVEPGLMYSWRRYALDLSGPWAIQRNRKRSVQDIAKSPTAHGDAAFSDYTIIASLSRSF